MTYTEVIEGEPVEKTVQDPIPASHEEVEQAREKAYESLTDKLCLEKIRKTALGTWTEEMEAEFVKEITERSGKIVELHPYPEDLIPETTSEDSELVEEEQTDDIQEVIHETENKEKEDAEESEANEM